MSNFSWRSASVASISALRRALPRLSTARSWLPEPEPRDVRGTSSAYGSRNAPTSTDALLDRGAGRVLPRAGAEAERDGPAGVVASAGRPERDLGRALGAGEQRERRRLGGRPAAASPSTSSDELVDDLPVFRTRTSMAAACARLDGDGRRDQRDGGTHGRKCNDAIGRANRCPLRRNESHRGPDRADRGCPLSRTLTGRTAPRRRVRARRPGPAASPSVAWPGVRTGRARWSRNRSRSRPGSPSSVSRGRPALAGRHRRASSRRAQGFPWSSDE